MNSKATTYVNELLLTPLNPFDIKFKKLSLMQKILWKCIFRASRRVSFSDFPRVALDYGGDVCPPIPLFFRIMLQCSIYALCNI